MCEDSQLISLLEIFKSAGSSLFYKCDTNGGEWAGPCPFCGGTDRFLVWPYRGNYWCRQCKKGGPIRRFMVEKLGYSQQDASTYRLDIKPDVSFCEKQEEITEPSFEWMQAASNVVQLSEKALWEPRDSRGLDYLRRNRCLKDVTIQRYRLGYSSHAYEFHGIYVHAGIIIPEFHNSDVWNIKARLFKQGSPITNTDKYATVTWSKSSSNDRYRKGMSWCFGLDNITGKDYLFLCEGEFDCMLLWQEAGDLVDTITLGSCSKNIPDELMILLKSYKRVFVCYDNDEGGKAGVQKVLSRLDSAKSLAVIGKDITDSVKMGQNMRKLVDYTIKNCA